MSYDYDAAGRLGSITYPSGRQVSYWYDSSGRPASIGTRESSSDPWDDLATNIAVHPFAGTWTALLHENGVNDWRVLDDDGRVSVYGAADGPTDLLGRALGYTDGLNLNNVWDQLNSANDEAYWYGAANRLQNTSGPWGDLDIYTDAAGNRTSQALDTGTTTTDIYDFVTGTNRVLDVTTNSVLSRAFAYDNAGNTLTDTKGGVTTTYTYNHAGRMASLTVGASGRGPYVYNGFGQLASRQMTAGVPASAVHMIYDQAGNLLAEANASTGVTMREYVWLAGRPVAVVDDVDTGNPVIYAVHVDHLDRPVMMTDDTGAIVWRATYRPFGEVHQILGAASLNYRFPGQWFMLETGLHYNWHRWYDPTLGRYTQPDPLGMPDGPSRYAYAANSPLMYTDPDGQWVWIAAGAAIGGAADLGWQLYQNNGNWSCVSWTEVGLSALSGALLSPAGRFAVLGREISIGKVRIAPFGNRKSNPLGWPPHYHRAKPDVNQPGQSLPGQGIGRHRPWETKSPDKSFWDRF